MVVGKVLNRRGAIGAILALSVAIVSATGMAAAEGHGYVLAIWKTKHRMELWLDGTLLREFEIALGRNPVGHKEFQGDKRTPTGRYAIAEKHHSKQFHRFLGINYPNIEDADRGYEMGLISAREWADLFVAEDRRASPLSTTNLGGRIGIHGYGHRPYIPVIDWTDGCIAVSNEEAEYLYSRLPLGTEVLIYD